MRGGKQYIVFNDPAAPRLPLQPLNDGKRVITAAIRPIFTRLT